MILTIKTKTTTITIDLGKEKTLGIENSDEAAEEVPAKAIDIFEVRSKCCGDKVITRGEDDHYECLGCGDECDIRGKNEAVEKEMPGKKRRGYHRKARGPMPCCGSVGTRHKAGCNSRVVEPMLF